jgi:hypothetical protein
MGVIDKMKEVLQGDIQPIIVWASNFKIWVPEYIMIVAALHVLALIINVSHSIGARRVFVPFITILVGFVLLNFKFHRKLEWQRRKLSDLRQTLAVHFNLKRLAEIKSDDFEKFEGAIIGVQIYLIVIAFLFVSFIWESKFFGAFNLIPIVVYLYAGTSPGPGQSSFLNSVRMNVVLQFISILSLGDTFTEETARRAVMIRIYTSFCLIESLDELFFHIVVALTATFISQFGWESKILVIPAKSFFLFVLPVEILGLRNLLARWIYLNKLKITPSNRIALVTAAVPLGLIFFSFGTSQDWLFSFYNLLVMLSGICSVASYIWGKEVDVAVHPLLQRDDMFSNNDENGAITRNVILLMGFFCMIHGFLLIGLSLFLTGFILRNKSARLKRIVVIVTQAMIFLFSAIPSSSDSATVMLVSSRVLLAFENRLFSEMAIESFALTAIQILYAAPSIQSAVAIICGCGLIIALATVMMKENVHQLMKVVKNADSFLDHALKQKFSSVGAAINQILETSATALDPANRLLLTETLKECRSGRNSCYLSSYVIQYQAGLHQFIKQDSMNLIECLERWIENGDLINCDLVYNETESPALQLNFDWELFRILICDMAKNIESTSPFVLNVTKTGSTVQLCFRNRTAIARQVLQAPASKEMKFRREFLQGVRKTVAIALGGNLIESNLEFPLEQPMKTSPSSAFGLLSPIESSSSPLSKIVMSGPPTMPVANVPKHLVFAVLDDSNLVRKSLSHMFKRHLHASPLSFVRGETQEEASFFPHELEPRNVDIAIFDENLEYSSEMLNGSALATQARARGFTRCAILHSANLQLAKNLDPAFNGFVEKTLSRERFLSEVTRVWSEYVTSTTSARTNHIHS